MEYRGIGMLEADNGASPGSEVLCCQLSGAFKRIPVSLVFLSGPGVHVCVFVGRIGRSENDKDETIPWFVSLMAAFGRASPVFEGSSWRSDISIRVQSAQLACSRSVQSAWMRGA